MSKIETRGPQATDSSDWNHAWSVVSQLAAARGAALRELDEDRSITLSDSALEPKTGVNSAANSPAPFAPIAPDQLARDMAEIKQAAAALQRAEPRVELAPDQLARDMAEIEQAAAALRRAEPGLEPRAPDAPAVFEALAARSVWPLVCVIWLTAVLVVSCTIGAVALLIG
jgi:hypothetical protein